MPKITKRLVDSLGTRETDYFVWDDEVPGFGIRVWPSGRKVYLLKYRVGGGRTGTMRRPVIGNHGALTPDQARTTAEQWYGQVVNGGDPGGERKRRRKAPNINGLCDQYLSEHAKVRKKASSAAEDERLIEKKIKPRFGTRKVEELATEDVQRWHQGMHATPIEANRCLALLSKMMSLAELWGQRPQHSNPCRGISRFEEKKRKRYLTAKEFAALGTALKETEEEGAVPAAAVAAVRLIALTGCRSSEVTQALVKEADVEAGVLRLGDSKTGAKEVKLSAPALQVIQAIRRPSKNPFLVPGPSDTGPITNLNRYWAVIREKAELPDLRLHDLRHAFASVGVGLQMSLPMVGAMLGHTQAATTQRYSHLQDDPLKQAVERVSSTISAAMAGKKGELVDMATRRRRRARSG